MRLTCPNCGAQYDVRDDAIPESGRDVQCSNCGHSWFQHHPDHIPAPASTQPPLPEAPRPIPAEPSPVAQNAPPAGRARSIDPEMADLFREERELAARQRAAGSLETQPDLGLAPPDEDERTRRSRQSRERMARLRGEDVEDSGVGRAPRRPQATPGAAPQVAPAPDEAGAQTSRSDLLPDVDEINQSLRTGSEPRVIDAADRNQAPLAPRRSGFGRGFLTVVVLAAAAIAAYAYAPALSGRVPQAAPWLDSYTARVDDGRRWLDGQLTEFLTRLDGLSSEASDTPAEAGGS